jgi:hypothetical protein
MKEPKPSTEAARALANGHIQALIANPPPPKPLRTEPDDFGASLIGPKAVRQIRELACKQTGLTMEQLIEAEKNVSHPREIVPVEPNPHMLARRRMKAADAPELHIRNVGDADPIQCDAWRKVRTFLEGRKGFLVLSGGKGTQKTGSACWALGQVDSGAFLEAGAIIRLSIEQRKTWERIVGAQIVVLDDLGTEKRDGQGVFLAAFFELFNSVYSDCRRMIVTCNLTPGQFKAEPEQGGYGARVYDRLRESGMWCDIGGESVRGNREPGSDDE